MSGKHRVVDIEPGPVEMRLMAALSGESVSAGFIPSVVMCGACGELPAQSREESVCALCEECAGIVFHAYMTEMSEITFITPYARHQAVYAKVCDKYGYDMMDAELAKMFD